MKRPLWIALLIGTVIAGSGSALAQRGPGFGPGGMGRGAEGPGDRGPRHPGAGLHRALAMLDLTEEQRTQVRALSDQLRDTLRNIGDQSRGLGEDLRAQFESGSPDATEVGTIVIAQHDLRAQRQEAEKSFMDAVRALLTDEQLAILDDLKNRRPGRPGMRGARRGFGFGEGAPDDGQ